MSKILMVLSAVVLASPSFASANGQKYLCDNVGGIEEYTIYVDLEKNLAGFFDNDITVVIPLKTINSLESLPPQTQYVFEGEDTGGVLGSILQIRFNVTRMTASLTLNYGTSKADTREALNGCEPNDWIELE